MFILSRMMGLSLNSKIKCKAELTARLRKGGLCCSGSLPEHGARSARTGHPSRLWMMSFVITCRWLDETQYGWLAGTQRPLNWLCPSLIGWVSTRSWHWLVGCKACSLKSAVVSPLKKFKTCSAVICYHGYRTMGLFLGVWELLCSQSMQNPCRIRM